MRAQQLHSWQVTTHEARAIQQRLARLVSTEAGPTVLQRVAGVDISSRGSRGDGVAAVVVLSFPQLELLEVQVITQQIGFPYVPGLLSFREAPLIAAACERLTTAPDLILVDGQGIAHPRRFGLASHLGLLLDVSTIGCAKSLLVGSHGPLDEAAGKYVEITHEGDVIGAALRTRSGVRPVYVSIGHKVDLGSALSWTLGCCRGLRLPEPTRLAHLAANGRLTRDKQISATK